MAMKRLHPAAESAAEKARQFGDGKVKERGLAGGFKLRRQRSAEVSFDQGPAEGLKW